MRHFSLALLSIAGLMLLAACASSSPATAIKSAATADAGSSEAKSSAANKSKQSPPTKRPLPSLSAPPASPPAQSPMLPALQPPSESPLPRLSGPSTTVVGAQQRLRNLDERLTAMLSTPQQCSTDADCGVLGLGSHPCGGPAQYRAYSRISAQAAELEQMAAEHHRLSGYLNSVEKKLSVCLVIPKPAVSCVQAHCSAANGDETY